ncbi:hypothetical protein ACRPK2_09835 [Lactococcus garvieae]|uniref:hypothetical protein n=1 Tax=Lactococcus garvieae TaxID=1363 RepID=UPI003D779AE2
MSTFTKEQLEQIEYVINKVLNQHTEIASEHLAEALHYSLELDFSSLNRALYRPLDFEMQDLQYKLFTALKSIEE